MRNSRDVTLLEDLISRSIIVESKFRRLPDPGSPYGSARFRLRRLQRALSDLQRNFSVLVAIPVQIGSSLSEVNGLEILLHTLELQHLVPLEEECESLIRHQRLMQKVNRTRWELIPYRFVDLSKGDV